MKVGVFVTAGVGVLVGVSVGVGVGLSTGVEVYVAVGVKVGLGVLVGVGVGVGGPINDAKEQPKRLTIVKTATAKTAAVPMRFRLVILEPVDLLSPNERHSSSLTARSGSLETSRVWNQVCLRKLLVDHPNGQTGRQSNLVSSLEHDVCLLPSLDDRVHLLLKRRRKCLPARIPDHSECVLTEDPAVW